MKTNDRFVVIEPKLRQYTHYVGKQKGLRVISDRLLTPSEVGDYRVNPHADDEFDGEDPEGDLVA